MKENSGFGLDFDTKLPTAPDEVFDQYFTSYPKAEEFKSKNFLLFDDLHAICVQFTGHAVIGYSIILTYSINRLAMT